MLSKNCDKKSAEHKHMKKHCHTEQDFTETRLNTGNEEMQLMRSKQKEDIIGK